MLTLYSDKITKNCQSKSRRELLKIGSLFPRRFELTQLLAGRPVVTSNKTVVMLNMQETFRSLKRLIQKWMPSEIRSVFGEVKTNIPGVRFGGHFKRLAKMADR